ncbi:MAG: NADH-quinone oxidoreductase subunit C [Desulfovibrio sp.]|jgi:NADH:ubiquinone oxidoreductase subunit C|nr:NADH-quinone oxidoreductase subunit C [Desulfovibrio sp.]
MQETIAGNGAVIDAIAPLCTGVNAVRHNSDTFGNGYHWFRLDDPKSMTKAAEPLAKAGARLCMASAYNRRQPADPRQEICYHFELDGAVYNITAPLADEGASVPSITAFFANADWHEREMMELYGVKVSDQPNPRRLFLDERKDKGLLDGAVPLSVMMNGACSKDLWEHILKDKESDKA